LTPLFIGVEDQVSSSELFDGAVRRDVQQRHGNYDSRETESPPRAGGAVGCQEWLIGVSTGTADDEFLDSTLLAGDQHRSPDCLQVGGLSTYVIVLRNVAFVTLSSNEC